MLGNFTYCNPTKLYFGKNALDGLNKELPRYGKNIMLIYGGGSIKKNGIYDKVVDILKHNGKEIFEDGGVMPNPTAEKLRDGVEKARAAKADLLLAVGGGSVCDYAKAVSVSVFCNEDAWDKYFDRFEDVDNPIVPVGCVLTMAGTGSEMNGGSVITNREKKLKIGHVFGENVLRAQSGVYHDGAPLSDDFGHLRHHVPHTRTVFFGDGRQYVGLYHGRSFEVADKQRRSGGEKPVGL